MFNIGSLQGGSAVSLAPDLTYPSDKASQGGIDKTVTGIDGSAGYATALSLTGKFVIDRAAFTGLLSESMDFRLTVDGVIIWDDTVAVTSSTFALHGFNSSTSTFAPDAPFQCESSLLLEIQTTTDTDVTLTYLARPIL